MNIFILDEDHYLSAKYHVDKHVVKMPLETAQLLCTAYWVDLINGFTPRALDKKENMAVSVYMSGLEDEYIGNLYTVTHINHPCSIWARSSSDNFQWLYNHGLALGAEYTNRYGKMHASTKVLFKIPKLENMQSVGLTTFTQAMPDQYKDENIITAYRNYYMGEKRHIANWKNGQPKWWN